MQSRHTPGRHRRSPSRGRSSRAARTGASRSPAIKHAPSRLTLGVAAATATTLAAISTSVAFAASPPPAGTAGPQAREGLTSLAGQRQRAMIGAGQRSQDTDSAHRAATSPSPRATAPAARPTPAASGSTTPAAGPRSTPASKPTPSPKPKPTPKHSATATAPAKPFVMYDSLTPQDIPAGQIVAAYADGANPDYPSQVTSARQVLWIDVTGMDPAASVLDIEPGCASPATAPGWVSAKLKASPDADPILYTSISEWSQVEAAVAGLPASMRSRIRWWIADPTGSPHIVPGSDATQWYWGPNYDISTALPGF